MTTTISDVISSCEADKASVRRRYTELMMKAELSDAEAKELRRLIATLGKTADELEDDRALAARFRQHCGTVASACGLSEKMAAAYSAVHEHAELMRREARKMQEKHGQLMSEHTAVSGLHSAGHEALNELRRMRELRPDLFGGLELPALTD